MATPQLLVPLPTEILVMIADELGAEDYGALRLACKVLEHRLFPYFAQKFFTTRHFFRNFYSLTVLGDISKSRLSPYVKTVVLGTELIPSRLYRYSDSASVNDCLKVHADQRSLCASGYDRDLLCKAFCKLDNLEGVEVREFEGDCADDEDDPNLDTSLSIAQLKAGYGFKSILEEFGISELSALAQDEFDEEEVGTNCVQAVLASAARAKKPLKTFKIVYQELGYCAISCDAIHIPFFQKDGIPPIISTIENLHLDVFQKRLTPWPMGSGTAPGNMYDTIQCDTYPIRRFLGCTHQVKRLTLRQLDHMESKDGFWHWMAADPSAKYQGPGDAHRLTTPRPVAFAHLEELHLGQMRIPITSMSDLIRKLAPTMRKLTFRHTVMYNISADPQHNGLPRNLWKEIFRVLVESCDVLEELEVDMSFSKRLIRGGEVLPPAVVGEVQEGQLMVWQRDFHYRQSKEFDIKTKLKQDMAISDTEERPSRGTTVGSHDGVFTLQDMYGPSWHDDEDPDDEEEGEEDGWHDGPLVFAPY